MNIQRRVYFDAFSGYLSFAADFESYALRRVQECMSLILWYCVGGGA